MIEDLHTFAASDSDYVALQGYGSRVTVNLRVSRNAIDNLPGVGGTSTEEQHVSFVRQNIDAFREIAEMKLERGEGEPEEWHAQPTLLVRIGQADLAEYLSRSGKRLSYAAFDSQAQAKWADRDSEFA